MAAGRDADVIVIGAGSAGCAAAVRLAMRGHDVLVLERGPLEPGVMWLSGELLHPVTQAECQEIGLALEGDWLCDRVSAVRNVYPDLSWTLHRLPDGFSLVNVDRGGFNSALRRRVIAAGGRIVPDVRVVDVATTTDAAIVRGADGTAYRAALVIDAGGRHAPSLKSFGLRADDPEFNQIAVAMFFSRFDGLPMNTWDRHFYGERGAMLSGCRITDGLYRIVLEADLADKQTQGNKPAEFMESIARKYDPWMAERIATGVRSLPLWAMAPLAYRVTEVARDRLLLAGDSTGYLSPVSGQGNEFAMRMGRLAAQAADEALRRGDLSAQAFYSYEEGRRSEVVVQVETVRRQLRFQRDREALLRASVDDTFRAQIFGPMFYDPADRGSLRAERAA
jgi:flavin-dependent dehydrogenase